MNDLLATPRYVYVTRKIEFNAAHRLFNPELSDEENSLLYGKCNSVHGHGHNYVVEITLQGPIDRKTGYLFDLKALKALLEAEIVSRFDHRHLNHDVPELENCVPTTEILAVTIWEILEAKLQETTNKGVRLHEVTIHETENNRVRYLGQ